LAITDFLPVSGKKAKNLEAQLVVSYTEIEKAKNAIEISTHEIGNLKNRVSNQAYEIMAYNSTFGSVNKYYDGSKYENGIIDTGETVCFDHEQIRHNVRLSEFKSTLHGTIIDSAVRTVIGAGVNSRSEIKHKILGITKEQADEDGREFDTLYDLICNSKSSTVSHINNIFQEAARIFEGKFRDGEAFIRFIYSDDPDLIVPVQIEVIDPDQIDGNEYTNTDGSWAQSENTDNGIVKDKWGKEIAYLVRTVAKDGTVKVSKIPAKLKDGRVSMIHYFRPKYAGQGRGISGQLGSLQDFQDLTTYQTALLKKLQAQSSVHLSVENQQQDATNPFRGQTHIPSGKPRYENADGEAPPDTSTDTLTHKYVPELSNVQPGSTIITQNTQGNVVKRLGNSEPGPDHKDYIEQARDTLSAANSQPGSTVGKRYQDSYSAMKGENMLFWLTFVGPEVKSFAADFQSIHREMVMSELIAKGIISRPGWNNPLMRAAWLGVRWLIPVMPDDISKTVKAYREATEYNFMALEDAAYNTNGSDYTSNAAKNETDFEFVHAPPTAPIQQQPQEDGAE
jgi:hypothetical protein